jgi:RHS repeat-associated protein
MGTVLFTKTWVWCGGTQPCEERDGDNQVTQRFFAQGFQTLASPSSLPASFYYTNDHLGSVREALDATGTLRARYDYDAWGNRTKLSGDVEADFGFTGHLHHKQTGLILTHYRAYDPRLARWLSRDPIAENGGINLYGYVGNNPVANIDPNGLWQVTVTAAFGGGGRFTVGRNSGQWNVGARAGAGAGLSLTLDVTDSGCQESGLRGETGWETQIGNGLLQTGVEFEVTDRELPSLSGEIGVPWTPAYLSVGTSGGDAGLTWGAASFMGGGVTRFF